jgi:hypothetical protein
MATFDEPVDLEDLLAFARAYRELGDAVGEQVQDLIDGIDGNHVRPMGVAR